MGVVTGKMLHRYMSEPRWTAAQSDEADRHVLAVENELEGRLFGARISTVETTETVAIDRGGELVTSWPVADVLAVDGVATVEADEGHVVPSGYRLVNHRLCLDGGVSEWLLGGSWSQPGRGNPVYTGPRVTLTYLGGWGAEPALVEAILRKARVRMAGRHADTIVVSGLNAQAAGAAPNESPNFTDDDIAALGRYRNLGWGGPPR